MKTSTKGSLEILLAAFLFGIIPIIVKFTTIDSYYLSFGRIFFALITLSVLVKFKGRLPSIKYNASKIFLFGLFHALIVISWFISIKLVNTAVAVILLYSGCIYLVFFSKYILSEKIRKITWFSLVLAIMGLILIFYNENFAFNFWGYFFGFLSGIFMTLTLILAKIIEKKYDHLSMTFYQNLFALPILIPFLYLGNFEINFLNIVVLIFLGAICTALAFVLLYSGIKKVQGQKIGIFMMLQVITPILLAFFLLKETPTTYEAIGSFFIFIGFVFVTLRS